MEGWRAALLAAVDRRRLDFDGEAVCCQSLARANVYACLTCGRFLHGRARNSPAHLHALETDHRLYLHVDGARSHGAQAPIFLLPENVPFEAGPALDDVVDNVYPRTALASTGDAPDGPLVEVADLEGRTLTCGYMAVSAVKDCEYANVALLALLHVEPIRRALLGLDGGAPTTPPSPLLAALDDAARRLWNANRPFKAFYTPHRFLKAIDDASRGRFAMAAGGGGGGGGGSSHDPADLLVWLLHRLSVDFAALPGQAGPPRRLFTGQMEVTTEQAASPPLPVQVATTDFVLLTLDLPPPPLFTHLQAYNDGTIVQQTTLDALLAKYGGVERSQRGASGAFARYRITAHPPYLLLKYARRPPSAAMGGGGGGVRLGAALPRPLNRTVVNYPVEGLVLGGCTYDLLVNITIDQEAAGRASSGGDEGARGAAGRAPCTYTVQLPRGHTTIEIDHLTVRRIPSVVVPLSLAYIQIWKRRHCPPLPQ